MIIRLAILVQCRLVTDRQTDTRRQHCIVRGNKREIGVVFPVYSTLVQLLGEYSSNKLLW